MRTVLLFLLAAACAPDADDETDPSETDAESDTDTDSDTDSDTDADAEPDEYPTTRGFEFDGAWYPVDVIQPCGSNGANLSTYSVGYRDGGSQYATFTWLFGAPPPPGTYTTSAYDGATGATEADAVLADGRDNAQWLTTGTTGSVTVYDAGGGTIDVVWHDVSLATVFGEVGGSSEGWVTCTLP